MYPFARVHERLGLEQSQVEPATFPRSHPRAFHELTRRYTRDTRGLMLEHNSAGGVQTRAVRQPRANINVIGRQRRRLHDEEGVLRTAEDAEN